MAARNPIAGLDLPDLRPEIREDLHDAWAAARDEAIIAYHEWCAACEDDREHAYYAYLAAADREEAAARHLQQNVEAPAVIRASLRVDP
jgi:hypothetical protein